MSKKLTWIEKLETIIPGFSGYKKKELAREDDRLIRNYIVKTLTDAKIKIEEAAATIIEFNYETAKRLNNLASTINYIADKVKFAESGYAPHYNIVKIELNTLEKMKEIDNNLVGSAEKVKEIASEIAKIAAVTKVPSEKLTQIIEELGKIEQILEERLKVLRGWSQ